METASKLNRVEIIFFEDLQEDYAGLWELSDMVAAALESNDVSFVREATLELVKKWFDARYVRPGMPRGHDSGFYPWYIPRTTAFEKIARKFRNLDRLPSLGEIAWFEITPDGERHLEELLAFSPYPPDESRVH